MRKKDEKRLQALKEVVERNKIKNVGEPIDEIVLTLKHNNIKMHIN